MTCVNHIKPNLKDVLNVVVCMIVILSVHIVIMIHPMNNSKFKIDDIFKVADIDYHGPRFFIGKVISINKHVYNNKEYDVIVFHVLYISSESISLRIYPHPGTKRYNYPKKEHALQEYSFDDNSYYGKHAEIIYLSKREIRAYLTIELL